MRELFYPKSITVIGASNNPEKLGYIIANNLINSEYKGKLWFVNPKYTSILGQNSFQSLVEIHSKIELSIVVVPAKQVAAVLEDLGKQKLALGNTQTSYAIIISSGFKESGEVGLNLEQQLLETAKKYNICLIGPNCLGVMNLDNHQYSFNGTFDFQPALNGKISLISQSGALISAILEEAASQGFGFNKIISLGNKADIDENELIEYFNTDEKTAVIALYLESFSDGRKLVEILKSTTKPVVILKSGRNKVAKVAASSHTGSIAGDEKVAEAFLDELGAISVSSLEEFLDTLSLLNKYQSLQSNKIIVITNAGGLGVISLDSLTASDLELEVLSQETKSELAGFLPPAANLQNPVDILGDAKSAQYKYTLDILLKNQPLASLVVILTPQVSTQVLESAQSLVEFAKKYPERIILPVFIGGDKVENAKIEFRNHGILNFETPERAILALNNLWQQQKQQYQIQTEVKMPSVASLTGQQLLIINTRIQNNLTQQHKILDFETVNEIAKVFDLKLPRYMTITSPKDLDRVFATLGTPVVVKSVKTDLLHRTEKKAVITNVTNSTQITNFLDENDLKEVIFQESIEKGLEVFAGIQKDANFGYTLVVGTGGIYAEALDDFALGPIPKNLEEVEAIFKQTKVAKILNNYRNTGFNSQKLYKQVLGICQIVLNFEQVISIDANPIIVTQDESFIVDLKIALSS